MLRTLIRFAKRLAVLLPSIVIGYLSIFNIFPLLNTHLPLVAAAIITYILAAYVLIPAIIRSWRILLPPKHLPLYCVTADGFASDPLNIGIIATRQELQDAMRAAGWYEADRLTVRNIIRIGLSTIYGWRYDNAPMSHLFLFGRTQDLGFQIPIAAGAPGSRHHVRFWAATYHDNAELDVQSIHWHNRQAHIRDDRLLWIGAATRDIGVTFLRHTIQLTHLVDSNTDAERDLIVSQFTERQLGTFERSITLGDPYKLVNIHALRGHLKTDGKMAIMKVTAQTTGQDSSVRKP